MKRRTTRTRPPAAFLDRDGTIIHDRPGFYLHKPEQIRFYRGTFEGLRALRRAGYRLVIVSNQSGIGRGFLDRAMLTRIHRRLRGALRRRGADVHAIYFCPHHPRDRCRCRKPSPLMGKRAVREMGLSLRGSVMIGDKLADVDFARALGIDSVLLETGHGRDQREKLGARLKPTHSARDILSAAKWVIGRNSK